MSSVAIDLDSVVYDFADQFMRMYLFQTGEQLYLKDWTSFHYLDSLTHQDAVDKIWRDPELFCGGVSLPLAVPAVNLLKQYTDQILFVTAPGRIDSAQITVPAKLKWLSKVFPWVTMKDVVITPRKEYVSTSYIVDDRAKTILHWMSTYDYKSEGAYLISQPWNHEKAQVVLSKRGQVASSLMEAALHLLVVQEDLNPYTIFKSANSWCDELGEKPPGSWPVKVAKVTEEAKAEGSEHAVV